MWNLLEQESVPRSEVDALERIFIMTLIARWFAAEGERRKYAYQPAMRCDPDVEHDKFCPCPWEEISLCSDFSTS